MTSIGYNCGLEEYLKYIKRTFTELSKEEQAAKAEKEYNEHVKRAYGYIPEKA